MVVADDDPVASANRPANPPTDVPLVDALAERIGWHGAFPHASFIRRTAAAAIDFSVFVAITLAVNWVCKAVAPSPTWQESVVYGWSLFAGASVITVAIPTLILSSWTTPTTFGKRMLGLVVTDRSGQAIGPLRSLGRIAARLVGVCSGIQFFAELPLGGTLSSGTLLGNFLSSGLLFAASLAGHLVALLTPRLQTLHDLIARTMVLHRSRTETD